MHSHDSQSASQVKQHWEVYSAFVIFVYLQISIKNLLKENRLLKYRLRNC